MAVAPRRSPRRPWLALALLALLIAGLSWVLFLRLTNQPLRDPFGFYQPVASIKTPEARDRPQAVLPPADGKVRALVTAREVPAYAKVSRDDLFDGLRGTFAFIDLDKSFAEDNGVLLGTSGIVGRVMARPKRAGFVFTEADFLPEGTRPGFAAGIPPGKRALRINVDLVGGIIGLNPGDRFDLIAASTVEPLAKIIGPASSNDDIPTAAGFYGALMQRRKTRQRLPTGPMRSEPKVDVIVQGGSVVNPLETRLIPTSSTSLTAGQITGTRPVQEMVIALAPEEVAPLMAALRMKADLTCVARSGRPEDPQDSLTPGLAPAALDDEVDTAELELEASTDSQFGDITLVETLVGGVRTLAAVPRAARPAEADTGAAKAAADIGGNE